MSHVVTDAFIYKWTMNTKNGAAAPSVATKFYAVPWTVKSNNGECGGTANCLVSLTNAKNSEAPIPLSVVGSGTTADPYTAQVALSTGISISSGNPSIYNFQIVIRACAVTADGEICTDSGNPYVPTTTYPTGQTGLAWGVSTAFPALPISHLIAPIIGKCMPCKCQKLSSVPCIVPLAKLISSL